MPRCWKTNKFSYKSLPNAKNAIRHIRKKGILCPRKVSIYRCEYCGKYHLAHERKVKQNWRRECGKKRATKFNSYAKLFARQNNPIPLSAKDWAMATRQGSMS